MALAGGQPVDNEDVVLWLPGGAVDDLIADFCSAADLYCSIDHLRSRIDVAATAGEAVDLAAAELGNET